METIDNWRKSRHSGNGGNCAEVASHAGRVLVRDTNNNGRGPVLRFSPGAWQRFADRVKRSLTAQSQASRGHLLVLGGAPSACPVAFSWQARHDARIMPRASGAGSAQLPAGRA